MYNKFRKTMEFISIIFITGIIFLFVRNFIMSMEVENIGIYYLKVVFGIIIGMYIFIKSVLEKFLFQNAITEKKDNMLFSFLISISVLIYIVSVVMYMYETFYNVNARFSNIIGILSVMVIYNVSINTLKRQTKK